MPRVDTWIDLGDLDALVDRALAEDLGAGDVTSRAVVPPELLARAAIVAKGDLVVAGLPVARRVFERVAVRGGGTIAVELLAHEGDVVARGTPLAHVAGHARALLAGERVALNLLQRLCGIATYARRCVDATRGACRIVDTRKTTPGLRALERYAVRCGGADNHRNDLGAGVLLKENHIRCAGGIAPAVAAAIRNAPHSLRVQCEVTTLAELDEALAAGVEAVLLDNMDDTTIAAAVRVAHGRALVEVSGGVTLERIPALAELGVDVISVGALTHSVVAADISLLFELPDGDAAERAWA
jgi:nicotinate-nucleotide pyrophosphorylase (carboxylating)